MATAPTTAFIPRFSPSTVSVLRDADQKIRALVGRSHFTLYHYWRVTMGKLWPVDSFYVGHFLDDTRIAFPYSYDVRGGQEIDDPDYHFFGSAGMSARMLQKKPYMFGMDNGSLLHKGHTFGDTDAQSRDAVIIPLYEQTSDGRTKVVGNAGMLSYAPNVYTEGTLQAFQWLSDAIVAALVREREDAVHRDELGLPNETGSLSTNGVNRDLVDIVNEMGLNLRGLRRKIIVIASHVPEGNGELAYMTAELLRDCEHIQTDTMDLLLRPPTASTDLLGQLTPAEREVAALIVEGLTNGEIAVRLGKSEKTVKTQVYKVMQKFEVSQRTGVTAKLRQP